MAFESWSAGEACGRRSDHDDCESACRFIEAIVSAALGISVAEIRAKSRGRAAAAFARQTAMYLAHVHFGLDLSQVGAHFGRDRTTVAHACARVEDSRDDPKFERVLACLEAALERWHRGFLAIGGLDEPQAAGGNGEALCGASATMPGARLVPDGEGYVLSGCGQRGAARRPRARPRARCRTG